MSINLESSKLSLELLNKSYINGQWIEGESENTYDIVNPFDRSVLTTVRLATVEQVRETFDLAKEAQKNWGKTTAEERKSVIEKAIQFLNKNREEIVSIISQETGGSILKANIELHLAIEVMDEALKYADELYTVKEIPSMSAEKVNHAYRLPLGVIASISPFNLPMNLSMRTIAPAIALGNSVVHKPDIQVGMSGGTILAKVFEEAGLPKG